MILRLKLKASRLKNVAGLFKGTSDPYACVYMLDGIPPPTHTTATGTGDEPQRIDMGSTEVVKNNLSPDWTTTFHFEYHPSKRQLLEICIYDRVVKSHDIFMGSTTINVKEVLDAKGNMKSKSISHGGILIVRFEKVEERSGSSPSPSSLLNLKLSIEDFTIKKEKSFRNQLVYFYQISRKHFGPSGAEWCVVNRSEHASGDSRKLQWGENEINLSVLCGNDLNVPLLFQIWRYRQNGRHVLVGRCETTVHGIGAATKTSGFALYLDEKQVGRICFQIVGSLNFDDDQSSLVKRSLQVTPKSAVSSKTDEPDDFARSKIRDQQTSFYDLMKAGYELNFKIAIDFTGSNGDPRESGTLHYLSVDGSKNDYEIAIHAIGCALLPFVPNEKVALWGFGAKYGGKLFNCFQCGPNAESDGVIGSLESYRLTLKSGLVMSGPTDLTEVISTASQFATSSETKGKVVGKKVFTVLLILTDGCVANREATIDCLQRVCGTPISIIIVGIGNADFGAMKLLNGYENEYQIPCHFVDFKSCNQDLAMLTYTALEEISSHISSYFTPNTR